MTVFAHFALFHSDQDSAAVKVAAGPAILGFRFVELGDGFMLGLRLWYLEIRAFARRDFTGVI
jgi:hypothetical protein